MRAWLLVALLAAPLRAAEVKGKVLTGGHPLPGCTVILEGETFRRAAMTDVGGEYAFARIPVGPAQVRFEMAGFEPADRRIVIAAGENVIAAAEMQMVAAGTTIVVTCTLGMRCTEEPPASRWDLPACDDYDRDSKLIDAAKAGDGNAIELLRQRYESADTLRERHRIGAALLGRVKDDAAIWSELAAHAEDAVRFADDVEELERWSDARGVEPGVYASMASNALEEASRDPRSKPLLYRALESRALIGTAIRGFAMQKDEAALPAIDAALARADPIHAVWLKEFASEAADRIAAKYGAGRR